MVANLLWIWEERISQKETNDMPAEAIILFAIALFALGLGIKNVYNRKRINNTVNFITGIGLIAVGITTLVGTIILLIASKKW
jgi:hypothetical protein